MKKKFYKEVLFTIILLTFPLQHIFANNQKKWNEDIHIVMDSGPKNRIENKFGEDTSGVSNNGSKNDLIDNLFLSIGLPEYSALGLELKLNESFNIGFSYTGQLIGQKKKNHDLLQYPVLVYLSYTNSMNWIYRNACLTLIIFISTQKFSMITLLFMIEA